MVSANSRLSSVAPIGYEAPSFPSLYWPVNPKNGDPAYLYYSIDIWKFTLFWSLIVFAAFHVAAGLYAFAMQPRKWALGIPVVYAIVGGVEATMSGSIVGLILAAVYNAGKILDIPVYVTTQNRNRLGDTVSELSVGHAKGNWDKTLFSMMVPELKQALSGTKHSIAIVGIESHICVTQTALDLLVAGHKVYIIADGVSSCNKEEIPIALARLRAEGATVTTSESWLYEVMGDAKIEQFRQIASVVKETKQSTTFSLQSLL
ncbi:hypothetical protein RUND412_005760 [Rhizina undulata]